MSQSESSKNPGVLQDIPFLIAIFRGMAALILGVLLFFIPDKSFPPLANLMGGFWLSSGLVLLHKDADIAFKEIGKRTSLIMGLVAIGTGLLVITRSFTEHWLDQGVVIRLLGAVVLLTGILHIWGELRISRFRINRLTLGHFVLGAFEVILGAMLLISPLSLGWWTYTAAMIWALVGGVTILGTAIYDHFHKPPSPKKKNVDRDKKQLEEN